MKLKILLLITMLAVIGQVKAGFYTANQILIDCESSSVTDRNDCKYYLAGVIDTQTAQQLMGVIEKIVCVPNKVTLQQIRKIFIKYANENPKELHWQASIVALVAFKEAFPCE